jgi:hypothetical protein
MIDHHNTCASQKLNKAEKNYSTMERGFVPENEN